MKWVDQIAGWLQPYKKRLVAITMLSFLCFPVIIYFQEKTRGQPFFSTLMLLSLIPMAGFSWSWGLFLLAQWYAPGEGPASLDVLRQKRWLAALYGRFFRLVAPVFLLLWLFAPPIVLVMMLADRK